MITLEDNQLIINFEHDGGNGSRLAIEFQRTFRVPDDGHEYDLPPGLDRLPVRHIEDCELGRDSDQKRRGGVIIPMHQTDALWLNFTHISGPPVALKVGAGKINAISGYEWRDGLSWSPQNFVIIPGQRWLDGFNVGLGLVRQFVAMPIGRGFTVEEQITPESGIGGIQLEAIPLDPGGDWPVTLRMDEGRMRFRGLGMGGKIRQQLYSDHHHSEAWDTAKSERCFVTLANSEQWISITGEEPPTKAITAVEYSKAGLPWFDYYDGDKAVITTATKLRQLRSIRDFPAVSDQGERPFDYVVKKIRSRGVKDGDW